MRCLKNSTKSSMILLVVELPLRFYLEGKLIFLNALDAIVLIIYYIDNSFKWKSNNKKQGYDIINGETKRLVILNYDSNL